MTVSKELGLRELTHTTFKALLSKTKFKSKNQLKHSMVLNTDIMDVNDENNMLSALTYAINVMAKLPDDLVLNFAHYIDVYRTTLSIMSEVAENTNKKITKSKDTVSFIEVNDAGYLKEFIWTVFKNPYWKNQKN